MPRMFTRPGLRAVEVGDAAECGALLRRPVKGKTFTRYSREGVGTATGNPCPKPITRNMVTMRAEWDLAEVRAWDAKRQGGGDWGGPGYHRRTDARRAVDAESAPESAPESAQLGERWHAYNRARAAGEPLTCAAVHLGPTAAS